MLLRIRPFVAAVAVVALALGSQSVAPAQDKDKEQAKKAKDAAVANMKKLGIEKPTVWETPHFIIAGTMTTEKAKSLGAVLEKVLPLARKAAKFDAKETAWKGKLTVYFLPDPGEFKSFMRRVLQIPPEGLHADFRADLPYLVDPADVPGKPTDADLYAHTAARVAGEHLKAKGTGTQVVPPWLRDGFGRATVARAEGTSSKRFLTYRAQARAAVYGPKGGTPPAMADVWGDTKVENGDALATSFADYLAYGPGAAKFEMFLDGLRPSEGVASPTVVQALAAAGWKDKELPMLEQAWRRWAVSR